MLLVAPQPFYEDRGTPIAVYHVLTALSQLHYQVDLVTYPVGRAVDLPDVRVLRAANPFRIQRVPVGFSIRKLLLDLTLVATMGRQLRRQTYVCLHAVEEAAFPAALVGRWFGVPVLYDMQSSLPEQLVTHWPFRSALAQRGLHRLERWLLRRVDAVVSSAGLLRKVAAAAPTTRAYEWHFPIEPIAPTDGAATTLRQELRIPPDAPVVLYAGTFEPYQGLPFLLEAVPLVRKAVPDAVFVLVGGDGAAADAITREAAQRGLAGALRLVGRKPRDQMPTYLAVADVLVSPRSYGENVPLKIFDYLASGRPIVATDVPAHRAVLNETRAALAEPSAAGLARSIVELLRDPDQRGRLASQGGAYAAQHLGSHRFVEVVASIYRGVAANTDRRVSGDGRSTASQKLVGAPSHGSNAGEGGLRPVRRRVSRIVGGGFWLPARSDRDRELAAEIARVYLLAETTCGAAWPGCGAARHSCVRRVGHDGFHRCECGTPYAGENGRAQRPRSRRRWRSE